MDNQLFNKCIHYIFHEHNVNALLPSSLPDWFLSEMDSENPSVFAIANYLFFHLKHPEKSQEEILEMIAVDKVTQMQYRRMRQRTEAFSANCSLERLKRGGAIEDYHCSDAFDINAEGVVKLKESDTAFFRSHSKEEWDKRVQDIFTRTGTENS